MPKSLKKKLIIIFETVFIVSIIVFVFLIAFIEPFSWLLTIPLWFTLLAVIAIFVVLKISPFDPDKKVAWNESTNDMLMSSKAFYEQGFGQNEMFGDNMTYDKAVDKYTKKKK